MEANSPFHGLTEAEARQMRAMGGGNTPPPPITKSALNHRLRKLVELGKEER